MLSRGVMVARETASPQKRLLQVGSLCPGSSPGGITIYMKYYKYKVFDWHYCCVSEDEGHFWICHLGEKWQYIEARTWKGIKAQLDMLHITAHEISALESLVMCGSVKE